MNNRSSNTGGRNPSSQRNQGSQSSQGSQQASSRSGQSGDRRDLAGGSAQQCPPGQRPMTDDEEE